ncbi:3658_t:CDS:2 [Cetraspora pellucida]|uniref:3658_t:CDS:1 n=1 Tax=Cetraspora pellucida TaxID=1433469 RepID=A0A9N9NIA9_9GLOM|nr:3658_t:CDS:2 [Cetraspora pellucida]
MQKSNSSLSLLQGLRNNEYWEMPYNKWDVNSYIKFLTDKEPETSRKICIDTLNIELEILKTNLKPKTKRHNKVLSLKRKIKKIDEKENIPIEIGSVLTSTKKRKIEIKEEYTISNIFKHFSEVEVYKDINFYIAPKELINNLCQKIINGHYIFVEGLRQSGKTTLITTTANLLQKIKINEAQADFEIYVLSFGIGLKFKNSKSDFWRSVCKLMQTKNRRRFFFDNSKEVRKEDFLKFFEKQEDYPAISFIIDEFSTLTHKEPQIVEEFIDALAILKNKKKYCVHSFVLVGIKTTKNILTRTNVITHNIFLPHFFNEKEVEILLNDYNNFYDLSIDTKKIAKDIFKRTNGYKGLVGTCFKAIETEVMTDESELSLDNWLEFSSARLIKFVKERSAFKSIIRIVKNFSQNQINIIGNVLRYGSYTYMHKDDQDDTLDPLLAEGLIVSTVKNEVLELECSSPILRSAMLSMISGPEIEFISPPLCTRKVDTRWLIENVVQHIAVQHVFIQQALNIDNNPSEYAFQAEFTSILKYLLSTVYPDLQYRVIVEAKDKDASENRLKRLDIFMRGHNQPSYGFELTKEAGKKKFDEHVDRACCYRDLHKCHMYMINLCTSDKLSDYFGSKFSDVTPVHVLYDINRGIADIIYEDHKKLVPIERSSWKIMLD